MNSADGSLLTDNKVLQKKIEEIEKNEDDLQLKNESLIKTSEAIKQKNDLLTQSD